tara:strand:+ start:3508 stop:4380 length:873 start_codon:yes stop_codon:yes gene_type:complete
MREKVGLIGYGVMGKVIADRLSNQGYDVCIHDAQKTTLDQAKSAGHSIFRTPDEVAKQVTIILLSLAKPTQVIEVVNRIVDSVKTGSSSSVIIVDTSTVDPTTSRVCASIAENKEIGYLDCPVLGRPTACGNWTLPVGGQNKLIEFVRPILEVFASNIVHVGPSGYGSAIKLLNNLMFGSINSITCEIFALCERLELETHVFFDTVANSGAGTVSNLFRELGPKIIDQEFTPTFSIDNLHKDLELGISMASEIGMTLPLSEINRNLSEAAQAAGFGQEDTSALVKVYEQQ